MKFIVFGTCGGRRKCRKSKRAYRIVPILGVFREQSGPVAPRESRRRFQRRTGLNDFGVLIMAFKLTATQQVDASFTVTDKKGNPAPVDGVPTWSTDNSDLLDLTPSADGKSCTIKAVGPLGTANVFVNADADMGGGTKPIIGRGEITVDAGEATVVNLNFGTPSEQPEEPPV